MMLVFDTHNRVSQDYSDDPIKRNYVEKHRKKNRLANKKARVQRRKNR